MRAIKEMEAELAADAEKTSYILNPDREILEGIIEGLAINEERLGYWSCPCRIASGDRLADFDIICPCEYRDPDLEEYGRCYCALYVTQDYIDRGMPTDPVPERRPESRQSKAATSDGGEETQQTQGDEDAQNAAGLEIEVWRCQVCGYLCAMPRAPRVCPICRAKRERFEIFSLQ